MDESRAKSLRDIDILTGDPMLGADARAGIDNNGEPLFVINLCAAMTPINLDDRGFAGLEQYKLYQVSRMEDGRRRYRLRLGFFTTESLAEDVLALVRGRYATAFTSCLCEEDLKHATGYLKCSVQDLQRTGRYAVQKPRVDPSATAIVRALDAAMLGKFQATEQHSETPVAKSPPKSVVVSPVINSVAPIKANANVQRSSKDIVEIVQTSWRPEPRAAHQPRISKPHTATQPIIAKAPQTAATHSPPRLVSAAPAPIVEAPKRGSLMRQAHAMAPMDAVERGKAVPANTLFKPVSAPAVQIKPPVIPTIAKANVTLEAHTPPLHTASAPIQKSNQAFHVGAGVHIPETSLSFAPSGPAAVARPKLSTMQVSPIVSPAAETSLTSDLLRARELAKESSLWRQEHGEIPTLDTTQTIRTLTKNELEDANRPKWFTVQLAISDHPANLDTMPRLDIFEAYSLYSVAVMEGSGIRHALRLGFFREAVSAEAVMGYLKTFFGEPEIVRISDAEHDRFIDAPKIHAGAMPAASVVTLEQKRPVKPVPMTGNVPTVHAAVERTASMSKQPARSNIAQSTKPMARSAAPAVKRATYQPVNARKSNVPASKPSAGRTGQKDLLDEARSLGLSDTAIMRVEKNPTLLSRLVNKLSK